MSPDYDVIVIGSGFGNSVLTVTALSERAVALWPNKGESDPRPALGATYQRVSPVRPRNPIVPESAPGALRLSAI
jgi:cholesterol oxidase